MKKLKILVDLDDVLNNLIDEWVAVLNNTHCLNTSVEDIKSWEIHKFFPSLTKKQVFDPLKNPEFWLSLIPKSNSIDTLRKIIKDGHTVRVVTATHYKTIESKISWLLEHYPYLTWEDVIITFHKQNIVGDILIDDGVHNLEGGSYKKILFTQPHNRYYDAETNGMTRVSSCGEIYKIIKKLAHEKCCYYNGHNYDDWRRCFECKSGVEDNGQRMIY